MKGILKKENDKWYIKYMDWRYKSNGFNNTLGNYQKTLEELSIELDPNDANNADSLCNTSYTLENKEVRFAFKEVDGKRYATLKNPSIDYPLDEIEQEILNETFKKSIKLQPTINSRVFKELGHDCIICESIIDVSESKQMCDECLKALKALILEKRAKPR